MCNRTVWPVFALAAAVTFAATLAAQPPPGRGRPPGPFGPGGRGFGGPLERAVDDLNLPNAKRDAALTAVRAHQDDVGRLTDLASAALLLKMKDILSAEEFRALKETTDKSRRGPGGVRRLTTDDVAERLLSFAKTQDGKVTKDDLPERMQALVEKGDTNKDGALDRDEIKKLAAELAKDESSLAGGPDLRGGPRGRGGPGSGLTPGVIERAVGELNLPEKKKEMADAAIKACREEVRPLTTLARAELLLQLTDVLSAEDFTKFKTTLERQPGVGERPPGRFGPPPGRFGPPPGRFGPPRP